MSDRSSSALLRAAALIAAVALVGTGAWAVSALVGGSNVADRPTPPKADGSLPTPQIQPPTATSPSSDGGPDHVIVGALASGSVRYASPPDARFVAPNGSDRAVGSRAAPWRTVEHAAQASPDNSVIVLRSGEYQESVRIVDKQLTLQAAPGEEVWFDGSVRVENFVPVRPGVWRADGWTDEHERLDAGSHLLSDDRPEAGWPEQVFLDGDRLTQATSLDRLVEGSFFVDQAGEALFIGSDPTGHEVRSSTLSWALYFDHADGSRMLGIGVRRYATPERQLAPIRVHCDDALVENLVSEDNAYAGISIIGRGNTVRQSTLRRNGQLGLQARYADGLYVGRSLLEGNNTEGFEQSQQAGGAKVTASRGVQLEDNLVQDNAGAGLWTDQSVDGATVVRNTTIRNHRSGIMIELSADVLVVGNISTQNQINGLYILESEHVRAFNNMFVQNGGWNVWILDGDRTSSDPTSGDFDRRFPVAEAWVSFDVHDVVLYNNVITDAEASDQTTRALIGVDDVSNMRSGRQMAVESNTNAFWRRSRQSTDDFSTWAAYPEPVIRNATLGEHRESTQQDASSHDEDGGQNPFVIGDGALMRSGTTRWQQHGGSPIPGDARGELGLNELDRPVGVPAAIPSLVASNR